MAPRKRTMRKRRGANRPCLRYEFSYIFNCGAVGGDKFVTFGDLGIDASRPCRPLRVNVNMCCSEGSVASFTLGIYGPRVSAGVSSRSVVNRSRSLSIGATARTITVSIPRATDFATPDSGDYVFSLSCSCAQPGTGTVAHVMVSGEVTVQFEPRGHPTRLK